MLRSQNPIEINATTTGFASPAETYIDKRLGMNYPKYLFNYFMFFKTISKM